MSNSSIWCIDRTLSGITTPSQSGFVSNCNKEILHNIQNSRTHHQIVLCHIQDTRWWAEFGLVYFFNGISTPYGLSNAEIWFIYKCLIVMITVFSMFHFIFFNCTSSLFIGLHRIFWYQVFLSNINNLHALLWFQVFLSNTNNLHSFMVSIIPI